MFGLFTPLIFILLIGISCYLIVMIPAAIFDYFNSKKQKKKELERLNQEAQQIVQVEAPIQQPTRLDEGYESLNNLNIYNGI